MEKKITMKYFIIMAIGFLSMVSFTLSSQDANDFEIEIVKVTESIFYLKNVGGGIAGNVGVCIGDDGVIIIDSQYAYRSEKIKAAIATLSSDPINFVLNTHHHGDHSDGNSEYGENAHIVAHKNARQRILDQQLANVSNGDQESVNPFAVPTLTFDKGMTMHKNGHEIQLIYKSAAHTDGDVAIYFKEANILHAGDLYVQYGWPFVDMNKGGDVTGMIKMLDYIASIINKDTKVIPGHGNLATRADVLEFRYMLSDVVEKVKAGIDKDMSLQEIIDSDPTIGYENTAGDPKAFIERTYLSLTM